MPARAAAGKKRLESIQSQPPRFLCGRHMMKVQPMSTWRDDKSGKLLCELHQEKPLDPACAGYPYAIGTLALVKVRFHLLQGKIGTLKTPDPTARKELEHLGRFMFFGEFTHEGCQLAWKQTDFLLKEYDDGRFEEVARDLRTLELEHLGKLGVAVRAQAKKIGVSDAQYEADLEAAVQAYTQKLDDRERGKPAVPPSPKQTPTADELRAVHHAALNFVET
ncbi:MAG: hypothetical protein FJ279_33195, partial [Planctomycetes bacterium]|nr:hypothetical protein [Planctomycetota bacterium]